MKKVLVAVMILCAAFLIPMAAGAAKPGFDDKEIRIAQWGPQTGPAAPWGSVARGSDILFKKQKEKETEDNILKEGRTWEMEMQNGNYHSETATRM